jgi:hypothetical protein
MLRKADRFKLHFGPYRTPRFKYGSIVQDEIRGEVKVVGLTDGRIQWPIGLRGRRKSLVMTGALTRAIRRESALSVAYWWGAGIRSVTKWRRALRVPANTDGTHRLRSKHGDSPVIRRSLRKAFLKSKTPACRAKVSATLKGRKMPERVIQAARALRLGRPWSAEIRLKVSETFKRRGIVPASVVDHLWSAEEDEWVRTLPPSEVVRKTGRSRKAVYHRRSYLKLKKRAVKPAKRGASKPKKSRSG